MTRQMAPIQTKKVERSRVSGGSSSGLVLQRKCACGGSGTSGGECEECKKKEAAPLQRKSANGAARGGDIAPPIVHEVLRSPGRPLDTSARAFFEPRFGHDFSRVRVHIDETAAESARAVNALAYTVGSDIAFAAGRYAPGEKVGRRLLAHELTHVVQQRDPSQAASADPLKLDQPTSLGESEARRVESELPTDGFRHTRRVLGKEDTRVSQLMVSRADPAAVQVTMDLGRTPRTGLQFFPANVSDTRVGPVTAQGGLISGGVSRLSVIIGENLTPRAMARLLLPLWTTATPFTPPGAAVPLPLDIITEDELARALLVYNQTFLPVPGMTNWRAGLRFPLPIEVDPTTSVGTLHPLQIRQLAGAFDAAWLPLLDRRAAATVAPAAATVTADVAAFLARQTTALGRGTELGARVLVNTLAELPFVRETFRQLGAAGFDVALAFMDNLVNREIGALAAQRDGAAILAEIRTALGAVPAAPTATQSESLKRANLMLALVAGVAAVAPPSAARSRAEKTVTIDTVKLDGSNHNPGTDVAILNGIFSQCNVRFSHGVNAVATNAETTAWLGGNTDLRASGVCGGPSVEEFALFRRATARFGLTSRIRAFFPATISNVGGAAGYSVPPFCATGPASLLRNTAFLANTSDTGDLAHEVGHILLDSGAHPPANLMNPTGPPQGERLTDTQCTTIYRHS